MSRSSPCLTPSPTATSSSTSPRTRTRSGSPTLTPPHRTTPATRSTTPPKSKAAAALLAFFLGSLSVHNFYLGYTAKATTQLVLFLVGCFFFWPIVPILFLIVVPIWAFVEFIMILVGDGWYRADANGVPLAS